MNDPGHLHVSHEHVQILEPPQQPAEYIQIGRVQRLDIERKKHREEYDQQLAHGGCGSAVVPAVNALKVFAQHGHALTGEAVKVVRIRVKRKDEWHAYVDDAAGLQDPVNLLDDLLGITDVF